MPGDHFLDKKDTEDSRFRVFFIYMYSYIKKTSFSVYMLVLFGPEVVGFLKDSVQFLLKPDQDADFLETRILPKVIGFLRKSRYQAKSR